MKRLTYLLCIALALGACGKKTDDQAATADTASATAPEQQEQEENKSKRKSTNPDGPAIATVETADFVLKVHKLIPFTPDAGKTGGLMGPKDGMHFVAVDLSVKNKTNAPYDMGTIMLQTELADDSGKSYGNMLAVLTTYNATFPSANNQDEYDAVWASEYAPGAFHRGVVHGFEVPKGVTSFTLKVPVKPNANEKQEAKLSL